MLERVREPSKKMTVTTCTRDRLDCKAVRRGGLLTVGNEGCARSRRVVTISNRVFYKELEEGACKILDWNMILLA
jgi:hypothetical protein